jgi:endonuclease/exonuclease/phosphatase family metal-dependent hydrolase
MRILREKYVGILWIVLGDFNSSIAATQAAAGRTGVAMVVNPGLGGMRTFRRKHVRVSAIDHIVVDGPLLNFIQPSQVDRRVHWAPDHSPVWAVIRNAEGVTLKPVEPEPQWKFVCSTGWSRAAGIV